MSLILYLIGIRGIVVTGLLCASAVTSSGLGTAIILPASLAGLLLSFMLLGIGDMLRALGQIKKAAWMTADTQKQIAASQKEAVAFQKDAVAVQKDAVAHLADIAALTRWQADREAARQASVNGAQEQRRPGAL